VYLCIPYDLQNKQRLVTIQHSPTGLSNASTKCSLRCTNWICIWRSISVFKGLNLVQLQDLDNTTCSRNFPHLTNPKRSLQCSKNSYPQTNPVNALTSCQFEIHFNITVSSKPMYPKWLLFRSEDQSCVRMCHVSYACHMFRPSHPPDLFILTICGDKYTLRCFT